MTRQFRYLLSIISCVVYTKEFPQPTYEVDWDILYNEARRHNVELLFAYALGYMKAVPAPQKLCQQMKERVRRGTATNYFKYIQVLSIINQLERNGILTILLKGFSLDPYYAVNHLRESCDTDIYVGRKNEEKARAFFLSNGFSVCKREPGNHHFRCTRNDIGLIEVHIELYNIKVRDFRFGELANETINFQNIVRVEREEGYYHVLGVTENIVFLVLHMVKHFISSGISIKLMLDTLLFYVQNQSEIDLERFWGVMERFQYEKLINTIWGAAIHYFAFPTEWYGYLTNASTEEDRKIVIDDLESGGYMGMEDAVDRHEARDRYDKAKYISMNGIRKYRFKMGLLKIMGYWSALFPNREYYRAHYPYTKKKPFLIPVAWLERIISRGFYRLKEVKTYSRKVFIAGNLSDAGKKRIEMFKKLGIM
jgi:hypothetical protein